MSQRTASQNALAFGMCALIPLPWVDRAMSRALLRGAYDSIAEQQGMKLGDEALSTLVEDRSSMLLGCVLGVLWWPIRKAFRTLLYFLTVKDVVDWTIEGALRGEMVRLACARGLLPERATEVRDAMDAALDRYRISPLTRWLLRLEQRALAWGEGDDSLVRSVGWLTEKGGGAIVLEDFGARLAALEGRERAALPGPVAGAEE